MGRTLAYPPGINHFIHLNLKFVLGIFFTQELLKHYWLELKSVKKWVFQAGFVSIRVLVAAERVCLVCSLPYSLGWHQYSAEREWKTTNSQYSGHALPASDGWWEVVSAWGSVSDVHEDENWWTKEHIYNLNKSSYITNGITVLLLLLLLWCHAQATPPGFWNRIDWIFFSVTIFRFCKKKWFLKNFF